MESLRDEKGNKQMALGRSLLQNRTRRLGAWLQLKSHQKRFPFINREIDNNPFQSAIMIRSSLCRRLNGSSIILSWKSRLIYSPKRVRRPNQFSFHFRDLSKFLGGLLSKDFNTKSFKRLKTFQIARLLSLNLWLCGCTTDAAFTNNQPCFQILHSVVQVFALKLCSSTNNFRSISLNKP